MLHPEQTLQLQLEISDTLTRHTTRSGIGLALAEVLNRVEPFEFFLHSIWVPGATSGYRISSIKNPEGKFEVFDDTELESLRRSNFEAFVQTGKFLIAPENAGVYQGKTLKELADQFPSFAIGYYKHNIRSMMVLNMTHENGFNHAMLISDRKEQAFSEDCFQTVQTLMPQVKMAFDNLFKYEELRQEEENKRTQLELNNVLLNHTNREDFGVALAQVINKRVPCERFVLRTWTGPVQIGYVLPLTRKEDGTFKRFEETALIDHANQSPQEMIDASDFIAKNPGIYQGEDHKNLQSRFPMFAIGAKAFTVNSDMFLSFNMDDTTCLLILGNSAEFSFHNSQYQLMQLLMPQIILAFNNLFNYESLREKEAERSLQLQVNNILMGHTNREDFGIALAKVINKSVPCERFVIRTWTGTANVGYRIPLKRKDDGTFERFSELPMMEYAESNPQNMIVGSNFMAERPGIYQGELHKRLREQYPFFALGAEAFQISSAMVFTMKIEDTTCIMILGNQAEVSFNETQYKLIQTLTPQIILALENLFKYEKMREEERERNTQLGIMTAFNSQGELEGMALEAIARINDFIPFEYWLFISDIPALGPKSVRLATKSGRQFHDTFGDELLKKIEYPGLVAKEFVERNRPLFGNPGLHVGDDFEKLQQTEPYYAAVHKHLGIRSLVTIPVSAFGKYESMIMMGSTRGYAFSTEDMHAVTRILPYLSMIHQQYHAMEKIQNLTRQLEMEKDYLVEEIKSNYNFEEIIGTNHLMKDVFKQISQVASTDSTVLILGETGTGKELIARAIHNQSPRKDKVLIKVNCASLPAQLIESELFGHEKGSFTGALEKRIGKFELANTGTIFLDEMGELPIELQAKLLRVLQEREIERIGGKQTIPLDVRIIAATNRDLETEVAEGRFRSDLYYRLNVFPINLPPLRERSEDIPMLITHFLQKYSKKMKRPIRSIKDEILQEMIQYEWPGNIRELENVIEQAVIVGDSNSIKLRKAAPRKNGGNTTPKKATAPQPADTFNEEEVYRILKMTKGKITGPEGAAAILDMRPAKIEEFERKWILEALQKTAGRIRGEEGAAELIGVKPTTLEARVKKLKIEKSEIFRK